MWGFKKNKKQESIESISAVLGEYNKMVKDVLDETFKLNELCNSKIIESNKSLLGYLDSYNKIHNSVTLDMVKLEHNYHIKDKEYAKLLQDVEYNIKAKQEELAKLSAEVDALKAEKKTILDFIGNPIDDNF
ncbi:MAG: hypothetical protein ACRDD8_10590 [Bacteroidales bacterium]